MGLIHSGTKLYIVPIVSIFNPTQQGPFGAGKTHTLQWLDKLDAIPLSSFLKVRI